jgi:hypothetical protein
MNLDPLRMIEVLAAVLVLGGGVWMYRRKAPEGDTSAEDKHYDTQGAVLLIVVAVILAIHGLGGLDYRPSSSELEMAKGLAGMGHR